MCPSSGQPWQQVFALGQFYLGFGIGGLGAFGENVKDEVIPVDDPALQFFFDIPELAGTKLIVEDGEVDSMFFDECS